MDRDPPFHTLVQLIDLLDTATRNSERVELSLIVEEVGERSFGPLLLIAGLITLTPLIGDIPGVPTVMALLVFLISLQLLLNRRNFWLPQWLLKRSMTRDKFATVLRWMRPPARFVDRLLRPRLTWLIRGAAHYWIAATCLVVALAMPPMELVPFSANGAGLVLTAFGLALTARDGLLALLAYAVTALTLGFVVYQLL